MILFLIKIHFKFCIKPGNLIGLWKILWNILEYQYFMPVIHLMGFIFQLGT